MTISRTSTYSQNLSLINNITETQYKVSETTLQIASGKTAQSYSEIATRSLELKLFEQDLAMTNQYIQNVTVATTRLQTIDSYLESMSDMAIELLGQIQSALNGNNIEEVDFSKISDSFLAEIKSLLNGQQEGRYLFSGSATNIPPVDLDDVNYTPKAGLPSTFTADTDYYQGNNQTQTVRIGDDNQITYGFSADEKAFEELLRGVAYIGYASTNLDDTVLEEAYKLVQSALDGLSDMRTEVGGQLGIMDRTQRNHRDYATYIENSISSIEDVDVAEATSQLSFDQVQLQAAYIALNRITSLTLLDYVR